MNIVLKERERKMERERGNFATFLVPDLYLGSLPRSFAIKILSLIHTTSGH